MVTIGTAFAANGNCPNGMPFCFSPINVRNGQVQCRRASAYNSTAWFASGPTDPFSASTLGAYSLSCFDGVSGENFPTCCRTAAVTGSVTCRSAQDWALTLWNPVGTAF